MRIRVFAAILSTAAALAVGGPALAQGGAGFPAASITLYDGINFTGRSVTFNGPVADLTPANFNDAALSVRVRGAWEICRDSGFSGGCRRIDRDEADLTRLNTALSASSVRPLAGGGVVSPPPLPGPGGPLPRPVGDYLELFEGPGFTGRSVIVQNDTRRLADRGGNDFARSARVVGLQGWNLCEHPDYGGRCITLTTDEPDLAQFKLASNASSARYAPREERVRGRDPVIELFSGPNYTGQRIVITRDAPVMIDIAYDDMARSARVRGEWTLCANPNFGGNCRLISRDESDLARLGLDRGTSSVKLGAVVPPFTPNDPYGQPGYGQPGYGQPGYGQPGYGGDNRFGPRTDGRSASFFTRPSVNGLPVDACPTGRVDRACSERQVDQFCISAGFREGAWFTLGRGRSGRDVLEDVLCVR